MPFTGELRLTGRSCAIAWDLGCRGKLIRAHGANAPLGQAGFVEWRIQAVHAQRMAVPCTFDVLDVSSAVSS